MARTFTRVNGSGSCRKKLVHILHEIQKAGGGVTVGEFNRLTEGCTRTPTTGDLFLRISRTDDPELRMGAVSTFVMDGEMVRPALDLEMALRVLEQPSKPQRVRGV